MSIFKYVYFYNKNMGDIEGIPEIWKNTLEQDDDVKRWISDPDFPNATPKMIRFIHLRFGAATSRMLEDEDSMPQSFVHWWCHTRVERMRQRQAGTLTSERYIPPNYPVLNNWKRAIMARHQQFFMSTDNLKGTDVITLFMTWLDQLYTDINLFPLDENGRSTIPRLEGRTIVLGSSSKSRRDTMSFIKNQGLSIFKERGFTEGEAFWKKICQKYYI